MPWDVRGLRSLLWLDNLCYKGWLVLHRINELHASFFAFVDHAFRSRGAADQRGYYHFWQVGESEV
jgi:hypothetical protein